MSWWWPFSPIKLEPTPPKPPDEAEYRLGFACDNKHVQSAQTKETSITEISGQTRICSECGKESRPATLKVFWTFIYRPYYQNWYQTLERNQFVHYLDKEPPVKLSDLAVAKIREYAKRKLTDGSEYANGLSDGVTEFAKFLESELTEEKSA